MKDGDLQLVGLFHRHHGGPKQGWMGPIVRPSVVPLVDIGPVQFITPGAELLPLDASMEHVEDVVEDLVQGELGGGPLDRSLEMRLDGLVEVPARDLLGERVPAELGFWCGHRDIACLSGQ